MAGPQIGAYTGANFSSLTAEGKGFTPGDTFADHQGQEWMYVRAAAAITQYDCVHIDASYDASPITDTLAKQAGRIGFAQVAAAASGEYGWVMISGKPTVRLAAACADDVPLFTSATAGVLDDGTGSASQALILGVRANGSASAGGVTAVTCVATYPVPVRPFAP
jgi:hypothetical protein